MATIVGISGSLRKGSLNAALLRAAVELAPAGLTIESRGIQGVPLYDGDLEAAEGVPEAVTALKEAVAAADGLMLVTPEYNNGIPGAFKNAIDWMSRPPADIGRVFGAKPVALIGASPGGFGTILAQNGWLPVLRTLGTEPWFGMKLMVSQAGQAFEDGRLTSEDVRKQLAAYLAGFAAFVERRRPPS
jgi:NAD(P)H-dependent FMN reductase